MIKNKQVSIWRGSDPPPTLYHIWFKDEELLLRYDDEVGDWVVFLDGGQITRIIADFIDRIDSLTINGYPLTDSPNLDGSDIYVGRDGHYVKHNTTLQQAVLKLDSLLTTEVYDL